MKRILALALCLLILLPLAACGEEEPGIKLSFKAATSYADLKAMDGQTVTINGYMATSSPVDGGYLFLQNLPYQSCPFCVPNTSQLSNTMAVYASKGKSFDYTNQAIKVTGKLVVAPAENQSFTDEYGYTFNFKIVNATYTVLTDADLSAEMAKWQKIAESGLVDELYAMYDYVNFTCMWPTYYVNSFTTAEGEFVKGYYLWPSDAERFLKADGSAAYEGYVGQYHYGYVPGYFDALIAKIEKLDVKEMAELIPNIREIEILAQKALRELENGNYTSEFKYVEMFDNEDDVYTLNIGKELEEEYWKLFAVFENWLASYEM